MDRDPVVGSDCRDFPRHHPDLGRLREQRDAFSLGASNERVCFSIPDWPSRVHAHRNPGTRRYWIVADIDGFGIRIDELGCLGIHATGETGS